MLHNDKLVIATDRTRLIALKVETLLGCLNLLTSTASRLEVETAALRKQLEELTSCPE